MKYILTILLGLTSFAFSQGRIYPVDLKGYILTDQQLAEAGNIYSKNAQFLPRQKTFRDLKGKNNYFVIFARNDGEAIVRGTLNCTVGDKSVHATVLGLPPLMQEAQVWVIPVGHTLLGDGEKLPEITMDWKEFEVK